MKCMAQVKQVATFGLKTCSKKAVVKVIDLKAKKWLYLCPLHGVDIFDYKKKSRTIYKQVED